MREELSFCCCVKPWCAHDLDAVSSSGLLTSGRSPWGRKKDSDVILGQNAALGIEHEWSGFLVKSGEGWGGSA